MYYVNDGVYGSFNCILYDHACCMPTLHKVGQSQGLGAALSMESSDYITLSTTEEEAR